MADDFQTKQQKIATFNKVYYTGDPNNWKIKRLPDWINFYGHSLDNELKRKSGRRPHYRKFKQGTIVMINYGVTIESEMAGEHFGVVLSNNDTQYKSDIVVVPLSSKKQRDYVYLGYDLLKGIITLLSNKSDNLNTKLQDIEKRLNNSLKPLSELNFDDNDLTYLKGLKSDSVSKVITNYVDKDKSISSDVISGNPDLQKAINDITASSLWEKYPNISKFISYIDTLSISINKINSEIEQIKGHMADIDKLQEKVTRYNKETYAAVAAIRSISKSRVKKFNGYSITGNVKLSDESLEKVKRNVFKFLE